MSDNIEELALKLLSEEDDKIINVLVKVLEQNAMLKLALKQKAEVFYTEERRKIIKALRKEANRIYNDQKMNYPSNVLDSVSLSLTYGEYDNLSVRK